MEDILNLYKAELARLQAERDAATIRERKALLAVAELREMVGLLQGTFDAARHEGNENDRAITEAAFEATQSEVGSRRERLEKLLGEIAAA